MSVANPLTFLDLCQRVQLECGVAGNPLSTVAGQVGEANRIVTWVSSAWLEIQGSHQDWDFFRATATWTTNTAKTAYSLVDCGLTAATHSLWIRDTFRNYLTSAGITGETYLEQTHYDRWRDAFLIGALRNQRTRPYVVAIAPDKSIVLGPIADNGYTILGDYFIAPQPMLNDTDTPASVAASIGASGIQGGIPTYWNMLIVYHAMMSYGAFENAAEVYNRGEKEYNKMIRRITADRLPEIQVGGALA